MNHNSFIFEISDFIKSIVTTLETWRLQQKANRDFANVDTHTLQDIGISDSVRFIEVNRMFWEK
ncbi:MAG: hypothetical protein ACI9U1_001622 [Porticoccaceae bacterium]|jgi:uncharacterized protein YjiS (DUF1127 family)